MLELIAGNKIVFMNLIIKAHHKFYLKEDKQGSTDSAFAASCKYFNVQAYIYSDKCFLSIQKYTLIKIVKKTAIKMCFHKPQVQINSIRYRLYVYDI